MTIVSKSVDPTDLPKLRDLSAALWRSEDAPIAPRPSRLQWWLLRPDECGIRFWVDMRGQMVGAARCGASTDPTFDGVFLEILMHGEYREMTLFELMLRWVIGRSAPPGQSVALGLEAPEDDVALPFLMQRLGFEGIERTRTTHWMRRTEEPNGRDRSARAGRDEAARGGRGAASGEMRDETLRAALEVEVSLVERENLKFRAAIRGDSRLDTWLGGRDQDEPFDVLASSGDLSLLALGWVDEDAHLAEAGHLVWTREDRPLRNVQGPVPESAAELVLAACELMGHRAAELGQERFLVELPESWAIPSGRMRALGFEPVSTRQVYRASLTSEQVRHST